MCTSVHALIFVQACKEPKIKQIRPNHDVSVISVNKRNTESTSNTEVLVPSPLTGHCDLPEYDEEFSTIIFIYNETASLTETAESVKGYRNPARVMLATVIEGVHMIIFQMNREAYLQVCMYLYNMCVLHTVCDLL